MLMTRNNRHTWDADKKEWIKDDLHAPENPFDHDSRSLHPQMDEVQRGLENLKRLL